VIESQSLLYKTSILFRTKCIDGITVNEKVLAHYLETTVGRTWLNRSTSITDTHVLRANLTNQLFFSFNRTDGNNIPVYPERSIANLGSKYYNDDKHGTSRWRATSARSTPGYESFLRDEYRSATPCGGFRAATSSPSAGIRLRYRRRRQQLHRQRTVELQRAAPFTAMRWPFLIGRFNTLRQESANTADPLSPVQRVRQIRRTPLQHRPGRAVRTLFVPNWTEKWLRGDPAALYAIRHRPRGHRVPRR
jgi:hypothetical protein